MADLEASISELWDRRDRIDPGDVEARAVVDEVIALLDSGGLRVAELTNAGEVQVHAWVKQAILLLFKLSSMETTELGPFEYADKIPLKSGFQASGVRVVPGASARYGSYLAPGVVMMPST